MNYKSTTLFLFTSILVLASVVLMVNFKIDPFCKYQCSEIDIHKDSLNPYYQAAQRMHQYPKTEVLVLGSSRGQTTSPQWIESLSGFKTLNLSIAGANLETKKSLIDFASQSLKLKRVIWYADYYEFTNAPTELSFVNINALPQLKFWQALQPSALKTIFDHNTLEASLKILSKKSSTKSLDQGHGSDLNVVECEQNQFNEIEKSKIDDLLQAEINMTYEKYKNIIKTPFSTEKVAAFTQILNQLKALGIRIDVILPGYHPQFTQRLKKDFPDRYQSHLEWKQKLKTLATDQVAVFDYFDNENSGETSALYWNDGDHFSCREAIKMLKPIF